MSKSESGRSDFTEGEDEQHEDDMSQEGEENQDSAEFVDRKFSLTKEIDDELDRLADEYYDGVRSRCIRCAIKDHKRSHDEENEFTIGKLRHEVDKLADEIQDLREVVEERASEGPEIIVGPAPVQGDSINQIESQAPSDKNLDKHARIVHEIITNADTASLTRDEIVEKSSLSNSEVRRAVTYLVNNQMLIEDAESAPVEYQLNDRTQGDTNE